MKRLVATGAMLGVAAAAAAGLTTDWWDTDATAGGSGNAVVLNTAGNLMVAGSRSLTGASIVPAVWLYSPNGTLIFSRTLFGVPGAGRAAVATSAGNVVMGGAALFSSTTTGTDAWLALLDASATLVWASTFHGPANGDNAIEGLAYDPISGNIAVTGRSTVSVAQGADLWVALMSPAGALLGQYVWPDPLNQEDVGRAVAVDAAGNLYVTGYVTKVMAQGKDLWVGKFSPTTPALTLLWSITLNGIGSSTDYGTGIAIDPQGNLVVTGVVMGSRGTTDMLVASLANGSTAVTDGTVLWARTIDGGEQDNDEAHAVVESGGFAYVTGAVDRFGGGFLNLWVAKFAPGGATVWESDQDGSANDDDYGNGLAVDPLGAIYVTGRVTAYLAGPQQYPTFLTGTRMYIERLRVTSAVPAAAAPTNQGGRPAPNPFRPGHGGPQDAAGITFSPLAAGSVVRVYTLAGSLVTELRDADQDGIIFWNAKTPDGSNVVSGVYVYLIAPPAGAVSRGKVVIIR